MESLNKIVLLCIHDKRRRIQQFTYFIDIFLQIATQDFHSVTVFDELPITIHVCCDNFVKYELVKANNDIIHTTAIELLLI